MIIWLKIKALIHYKDDEMVLAKTDDERIMIFKISILKSMLEPNTPKHLQFPATHFIPVHVLLSLDEGN